MIPITATRNKYPESPGLAQDQRGAALAISLILLVIITLLGIASMRNTGMQERMTANFLDRSLAYQSAESGLRVIETRPTPLTPPPIANIGNYPADLPFTDYSNGVCNTGACVGGYCPRPDPECTERAYDAGFTGWLTVPGMPALGALTVAPVFFGEHMGEGPSWLGCEQEVPMNPSCMTERFRASTRSNAVDRADVVLQINYTQF